MSVKKFDFFVKMTGPTDQPMVISTGPQDILLVTDLWTSENFKP